MKLLDKLTNSPIQRYTVVTEDGNQIDFVIRFLPSQKSWIFDAAWSDWAIKGAALNISPNVLFNYANNIPFGFLVTSVDGIEPAYIDDFSTGRIKIYSLTQADISLGESILI